MKEIVNIFYNNYDRSEVVMNKVKKDFEEEGYQISFSYDENAKYNVVIGGDGTFIKAVHDSNFSQIPFIGINTGHLGFYQEVPIEETNSLLPMITQKKYCVDQLSLIDCKVVTDEGKHEFLSLNEVVFKAKYTSIIHFDMYVNDVLLQSFAGDGIIFSTPSGSTAYNLSAGGSMLYQTLDGYQITPMAPIKSSIFRSLDKSLVVPSDTKIKLITRRREESFSSIGIDGMLQEFENIKFIEITMSDKTINKMIFNKDWYWLNIKEKFL